LFNNFYVQWILSEIINKNKFYLWEEIEGGGDVCVKNPFRNLIYLFTIVKEVFRLKNSQIGGNSFSEVHPKFQTMYFFLAYAISCTGYLIWTFAYNYFLNYSLFQKCFKWNLFCFKGDIFWSLQIFSRWMCLQDFKMTFVFF